MGVKPYAIASTVQLIIAQRLARKLCESCKEVRDIPSEALLQEGFTQDEADGGMKIFGPVGCKLCNDGYKGRLGVFQVLPISDAIERIIMEGGSSMQIAEQAEKDGVVDLRRAGLQKVKDGLTGLEEINRVTIE
jgi:type IV pilus assembly protein PilB